MNLLLAPVEARPVLLQLFVRDCECGVCPRCLGDCGNVDEEEISELEIELATLSYWNFMSDLDRIAELMEDERLAADYIVYGGCVACGGVDFMHDPLDGGFDCPMPNLIERYGDENWEMYVN